MVVTRAGRLQEYALVSDPMVTPLIDGGRLRELQQLINSSQRQTKELIV